MYTATRGAPSKKTDRQTDGQTDTEAETSAGRGDDDVIVTSSRA